jgi:hypothetical protein
LEVALNTINHNQTISRTKEQFAAASYDQGFVKSGKKGNDDTFFCCIFESSIKN